MITADTEDPPIARLIALQLTLADGLRDAMDRVWEDGDAVLPVDPALPRRRVDELLDQLRPAEFLRPDGRRSDPSAPPVPDGTAVVMTTSGTTGQPKGIVVSEVTLAAAVDRQRRRLGAADGQPWLGVLPLHHIAGICLLRRSRAAGVEPTLHERDSRASIDLAPPSWISLVPTQLDRLLDEGAELDRHLGVLLGGARPEHHLVERAQQAGIHLVVSYGMTETCGGCVYDGVPLDDVDVRLDSDGVVEVRGPVVAVERRVDGGVHRPLGVDVDGWMRTQDRGSFDGDDRLSIHGRADDVVVSGGENVPLDDVRHALAALPFVSHCAVVGVPDRRWGEAVTAVVVPADGRRLMLAEVRDALRGLLPPTHLPTKLLVVDQLPRDRMGKVSGEVVAARMRAEGLLRG